MVNTIICCHNKTDFFRKQIRIFLHFSICMFQCEPGLGASVMYNLLYNKPQKLMLLAGCSTVCTTVAEAAKMWNLIVVSFVIKIVDAIVEYFFRRIVF